MGLFKKTRFRSKEGDNFFIFSPTVIKKGSVRVKGKDRGFVKRRKKK